MSTVLITGASGFIGNALAAALKNDHEVICVSRRNPGIDGTRYVRGDFAEFEDLGQLDDVKIDVVVHLAAVTGGCLERDGVLVNCEGTRVLMRYLIDRGCAKFVMASSTAVVGFQNPAFRPTRLPIPDDHGCLDKDGYGFSKHLMEQITHYYWRQNRDIEVTNLRLASILPDEAQPGSVRDLGQWAVGSITGMLLGDTVRLLSMVISRAIEPGVHTINATCSQAWISVPTAEILGHWWGDDLDLSYYRQPGHEYDSVYDVTALKDRYGFTADATLQTLEEARARAT